MSSMEGDNMFHPLPINNKKKTYQAESPGTGNSWNANYQDVHNSLQEPYHSTPKPKTRSSPSTNSHHKMSSFSTPSVFHGVQPHTRMSGNNGNNTHSSYASNKTSPHAKGAHSSPAVGGSAASMMNTPPTEHQHRTSPSTSFNTTSKSFMSELETNTIQKQRRELQLLIAELQDRDRELNEMVASHQKQLLAWEHDRQKLLTLEQRYTRVQGELGSRTDQMRTLTTRIKVLESQNQSKTCAIESAQQQLQDMAEKTSSTNMHLKEVQDQNSHLNSVIRDLSSKIGNLEAREQELLTMVKLKDKDLAEASTHLADVAGKLKKLDQCNKEIRQSESKAKKEIAEWKHKHNEAKAQTDELREEVSERHNTTTEQSIELGKLREQISALKRECILSEEREKRKEQLLELQRSKQERTDSELSNLRQIYERQQRDLALLQLNLDCTQDKMKRNGIQLNNNSVSNNNHISRDSDSPSPIKSDTSSSSPPLNEHYNGVLGLADEQQNNAVNPHQHDSEINEDLSDGSADTEDLLRMSSSEQGQPSPTSKLQRLLTESRQMVQSLEQTALPPYVQSPNKQNGSFQTHNSSADNS